MTEAYDEDVLIAKLISLIRELGKFPVEGDLRMKGRNDPEFPSHTSFRRLGSKNQRLLKVTEYCRRREGFQDVLNLCPNGVDRKQKAREKDAGTDANTNLPSNFQNEPTKCTKSAPTIQSASKHIGTTGSNRNAKTANGLISARLKSKLFGAVSSCSPNNTENPPRSQQLLPPTSC
jgi:hypothetical protein